ncbi:MAG TPA: hypothetical protein VFK37_06015 [Bacillales bacterium]|nr:hypothetical protein [Bacillales bacterium]
METKWFQSKKFWTFILLSATMAANGIFGWHLNGEEIAAVAVPGITYILAEFFLDHRRIQAKNPFRNSGYRDSLEDLVSEFYDYATAKNEGIDQHAQEVKGKVMNALYLFLDPDVWDHAEQVGTEIWRMVLKLYREDKKVQEGADLAQKVKKAE